MKRFLSLAALILICAMTLVPFSIALATDGEPADDLDGEMTILGSSPETAEATPEATAAVSDENLSLSYSVFDGEGKETRRFSGGTSCFSSSFTFYTNHDYTIKYVYVNSSNAEYVKDAEIKIENCDPEMQKKYLTVEGNTVRIKAAKENFSFTVRFVENGAVNEKIGMPINVSSFKIELTDIILLGIGVYALVTAITGTGAMFRNEFIKEGKEDDFKKYVRICAAVVGVCILGAAAVNIFGCSIDQLSWVKYVLFGIAVAALIASLVITSKMTDKEKKAKAMTGGRAGATDSSAAFEFDENEPTIDDVLANMKNKDEN